MYCVCFTDEPLCTLTIISSASKFKRCDTMLISILVFFLLLKNRFWMIDHRLLTNVFQRIVNLQTLRLLKDCWPHHVMICGHTNNYMLPYLRRSANICHFLLTEHLIYKCNRLKCDFIEIRLLNWRVDPGSPEKEKKKFLYVFVGVSYYAHKLHACFRQNHGSGTC